MIELLMVAWLAQASVAPNTPFKITADHNGTNVTEYRLVQNGTVVQTAPKGPNPVFSVPGVPVGSYIYAIRAANVPLPTDPCVVNNTKLGIPNPIEYCTGVSSSGELTVMAGTPPPQTPHVSTITATPGTASAGQPITVAWTCTSQCSAKDWIGLFLKGGTSEIWWSGSYTQAKPAGTLTQPAPATAGAYEFRYCRNDGYTCPTVAAVTVGSLPSDPCKVDPLTLDVVKDPTGLYLSYVTNKPAKVVVDAGKVTATDSRGCVVSK